jgi:hypothetical protein
VPTDAATVDESPTQPFAPPGTEGSWLEPMPGTRPSATGSVDIESTDVFTPFSRSATSSGASGDFVPEAPEAPIPNGGFDDSTEGWRGSNSALTLVRGVAGRAVRVSRANSRAAFAIVAGKAIASPKAGARYRAGAFVRSVSPGMFVCLRAEEFSKNAGGVPITTERCSAATTGWQRLKVDTRTTAKGSRLVFSIRVIAALGGTSFDVDGFRLAGQ